MARYISAVLILLSIGLALRGLYVWNVCGYDCPAVPFPTLTATGAIVFAALAGVLGLGVFLASFLASLSKRH